MEAQSRVIIENVKPNLENGRYIAKSIVGDPFEITADIFADGHDVINAHVLFRQVGKKKWEETRCDEIGNDEWRAEVILNKQDYYEYKIEAWIDYALTWHHGLLAKIEAGQNVEVELKDGLEHLNFLKSQPLKQKGQKLVDDCISGIKKKSKSILSLVQNPELESLIRSFPAKRFKSEYDNGLQVYADCEKAVFSTWYEFFPRSSSSKKDKHGTFKDAQKLLPRIAEMGFDTLYFPPVHPIGEKNRKGKNNTTDAKKGDVGSPWAIGSKHGGHTNIHPELGTLADFKGLVAKAKKLGIEVAMDFALQAAPDHPYVKDHPSWFKWRSDGTVQYAENPPKKYQDILPFYFETEEHKKLWAELIGIVKYWVDQGIVVFRVDNPHTKPFHFWKQLIEEIKAYKKEVIFLAEAFSRPKIMEGLAKAGFTQSYTYFTWRHTKADFIQYLNEITKTDQKDYFRPNFWPNTPDILPYNLQGANETEYLIRYFMAFTLSSNAGVYGPVYEYMISDALPGREEYLNSEKFEFKTYDWDKTNRLTAHMSLINKVRKENSALQRTNNIQFCEIDNDNILAYFKSDPQSENFILAVVNLDVRNMQTGWVQVPLSEMGIENEESFRVHDLISGSSYHWNGEWNFVELRPPGLPYHLFSIQKISK
jgi:starch synthase (maltosyl-transferring)